MHISLYYMYIYTYTHICRYIMYVCVYIYIYMYTYMCVYMYVHTCVRRHVPTASGACFISVKTYIALGWTRWTVGPRAQPTWLKATCVCTYIYIYIYMHIHIHIHIHTHIYIYIYVYTCSQLGSRPPVYTHAPRTRGAASAELMAELTQAFSKSGESCIKLW